MECDLSVELFTKDSNPEDPFWERRARPARSFRDRNISDVCYRYEMNIGATGRLILRWHIQGCQILECCNIPLRATGVAIKVDGHPWQPLVFEQARNLQNPWEIVAHLTQDAFEADVMRIPSRRHGSALSDKFVPVDVMVHFDVERELRIAERAKTKMYCRMCRGGPRRYIRQKMSDLYAYLPQAARNLASDIGQGTLAVVKFPRSVKNKLIGKSDGANT